MVAAAAQAPTAEVGGLSAAQSQLRGDGSRLKFVENNERSQTFIFSFPQCENVVRQYCW